jgi:hypothetical protein
MPIGDPIGCFAEIQRSEAAVLATLESENPIGLLFCKSEEPLAEVEILLTRGWFDLETVLQTINNLAEQSLLEILISSRFLGNEAGGLLRLRDGDDLRRYLHPRLQELDTFKLVFASELGESVISVRKHALGPLTPVPQGELRVAANPIGSGARTVPRYEGEATGWIDDFSFDARTFFILVEMLKSRLDEDTIDKQPDT